MLVRFLVNTEYRPTADDSLRCYGQLRQRASTINVETEEPDGTISIKAVCGPMVHYFPKGATPELVESVARAFIAADMAEPFEMDVKYVTREEILKDMAFP